MDRQRTSQYTWFYDEGYAACYIKPDGERKKLYLQRFIMGLSPGDPRRVTFKDGDTLNCCRDNLEVSAVPLSDLHAVFLKNMGYGNMAELLAEDLGVSPEAVRQLQVGFWPLKQAWCFPERDPDGKIIGLTLRSIDARKWMWPGSKRGLFFMPPTKKPGTGDLQVGGVWYHRVNTHRPCPICDREKWCLVSNPIDDPVQVICMKIKEGSIRPVSLAGTEGFLHVRGEHEIPAEFTSFASLPTPVIVTEGASDCLMAMSLGYAAVGLPSAGGGIPELKKLLAGCSDVIVVGDNDGPDGPGRRGAVRAVENLTAVCKQVRLVFPPASHKDLRAWAPTPDVFDQHVAANAKTEMADNTVDSDSRMMLAEKFLATSPPIRYVHGDWWRWNGTHYDRIDEVAVESDLYEYLATLRVRVKRGNDVFLKSLPDTGNFIADVRKAVSRSKRCFVEPPPGLFELFNLKTRQPVDPTHTIVFRNGLFDVDMGELQPLTPDIFVTSTLPYEYSPNAQYKSWLGFAMDVFNGDRECHDLLQEFAGYCLVADTSFQSMLFMIGRPGSGKSTVANVLQAMLGEARCCGSRGDDFKENFGLEMLVGKYLTTIREDENNRRTGSNKIMERIKMITGQDVIRIPRKYEKDLSVKLSCKIIWIANELPDFIDSSGSMIRRTNLLFFENDYYEAGPDRTLQTKLLAELPGIAQWALVGLKRLLENGKFTRPKKSEPHIRDFLAFSNPLKVTIEDYCELCDNEGVLTRQLHALHTAVCIENGDNSIGSNAFGRRLKAAYPQLERKKKRFGTDLEWVYEGVRILPHGKQLMQRHNV